MTNEELIQISIDSQRLSYSPYSKFKVGAALLTPENIIYVGANIENAAYPVTICAERTAFIKAILDEQTKFIKIAITASSNEFCYPCGSCRQFMNEFTDEKFEIIVFDGKTIKSIKLTKLLPHSFGKSNLL